MAFGLGDRGLRVGWRIWRRRLIAIALLAVAIFSAYWFWFRNSTLVAVTEVEVRGTTVNQRAIARALDQAGRQMTTLNVEESTLVEALGRFPTVAAIRTSTDFPHKLTVIVRERPPVAVSSVSGKPTGVSADGYALIGLDVSRFDLPSMGPVEEVSADGRVDDHARAEAAVLGGTPGPLVPGLVSAVWDDTYGGVVVDLSGAPELRFGDGRDIEAKWASASALLADPELGSPGYLDVSAPGRPVAG